MKRLTLLALLSVLALWVWGCPQGDDDDADDDDSALDDDDDTADDDDSADDDDDDTTGVNITSSVEYSECLGGGQLSPTMATEQQGAAVLVHLADWELNCCLEMAVEVLLDGEVVKVFLTDHGEPCNCICGFDVDVTIHGIPAGTHDLVVFFAGGPVANGTVEVS